VSQISRYQWFGLEHGAIESGKGAIGHDDDGCTIGYREQGIDLCLQFPLGAEDAFGENVDSSERGHRLRSTDPP
jgi:hypothetical protein